ncbi:MAG TPA: hypothetical protein VIV58_16635 [Kofleriaceae bacterium]
MASRLAKGFAFLIVCVAMFEVPSSLLIARGYSPWLALGIGAAVFPIVPLVWHVIAERGRTAPSAPSTTTGWKRLLYRTLGVAAITSAIVVVGARSHVRDALHDHLLWFLPDRTVWFSGDPPPVGSQAMCEAYATMENKCEDDTVDYTKMVQLCTTATKYMHPKGTLPIKLNIEVAEQCAIKTVRCDDYHECEHPHE